jgi:small subunit ribosomal protein S2
MPFVSIKELVEAVVHFGCSASRWNPKMKPYIHAKQNKIHIIDLRETLKGLIRARHFLAKMAAQRKRALIVGTKRQAADVVRAESIRSNSHFVATRWLGGTLTNMNTMRSRIQRLEELESLEKGGAIQSFSKKMISNLARERKKIGRNFEGIREMKDLQGCVIVVDPRNEPIAVAEAVKLNVPLIAIADTDCNPDPIDFLIPANDESLRSIQILVAKLADAIVEGSKNAGLQEVLAGKGTAPVAAAATPPQPVAPPIDVPADLDKRGAFSFGEDRD